MKRVLATMVLLALAAPGAIATDNDAAAPGVPTATETMFDMLYEFALPNLQCVGLGWDGQYFWVSAGDADTGFCEFYIYDEYGTLVDGPIHQGGGATGWGHRDMCYNGNHMFGSFSPSIDGFVDPLTFSGYFGGPISPNRALAFDGDYFYTSGFGEFLWRVDWDGVWGSSAISEPISGPWDGAYGLAYDCGNDCLWMSTADYTGDVHQLALDGTLITTYTTIFGGYDLHGGCTMADTRFGYVLAILMQSATDMVVFYDVESSGPSPAEEGSWGAIKSLFR